MSPWGWRPERTQGVWRHGALWLKPVAAVSPWATAALCLLLMCVVGNSLTSANGTLFDLPAEGLEDGVAATSPVALVMQFHNETIVFFDDVRYALDDSASATIFGEHLMDRMAKSRQKTLLVLADRRVSCDDLMRCVAIARAGGVEKILLANKRKGSGDE